MANTMNRVPLLPVLLSLGVGYHAAALCWGCSLILKVWDRSSCSLRERNGDWQFFPVSLSQEALCLTLPFPLVSPQDVGSLDEKMKSLDVNQDSKLKFNEYWRLIGELAKEIRKEKALEIRKK